MRFLAWVSLGLVMSGGACDVGLCERVTVLATNPTIEQGIEGVVVGSGEESGGCSFASETLTVMPTTSPVADPTEAQRLVSDPPEGTITLTADGEFSQELLEGPFLVCAAANETVPCASFVVGEREVVTVNVRSSQSLTLFVFDDGVEVEAISFERSL